MISLARRASSAWFLLRTLLCICTLSSVVSRPPAQAETAPNPNHNSAFPQVLSKKGLQVQMVDDALALGVKHAALNLNLGQLLELNSGPGTLSWTSSDGTFYFNQSYLRSLDSQVRPLSEAGAVVSFILLYYKSPDEALNRILLHPRYDAGAPNRLSAFNTSTPEGIKHFRACLEFLADRYARSDGRFGRAANFIVGNEVNSHWEWYNMGRTSPDDFALDYFRTVQVAHQALRKAQAATRTYISLEHHWTRPYQADPQKGFSGRWLIEKFNDLSKIEGNFDWHIAFHPYPENLFEPRTWNDKTATDDFDSPRITFKNLAVLPRFLAQPHLLFEGKPRRVILSEQGFHSPPHPEGELWQAAAYCYAYYKTVHLEGIDSFILHRHVDHRDEGGLNLGLWTRKANGTHPADPERKKRIYEVFHHADTPAWRNAFQFALPIIGIEQWESLTK